MKKLKTWLLKDDNRHQLYKIICAFLFPILVCTLHCLRLGGNLGDVYLANSRNNDDLFYFKQVESIIEYGIPQGFFGFNESHAANLSFAAWSPLTLIVWAIWGKIFGWSISSYYWCNIIFHSFAFAFFTWQVKPKAKQMIAAGVLIGLFPGFSKYTLSCLVETHMISYMVFFYGMALGYAREAKTWKLVGMFLLGGFLTCIRPYLVLLTILPGVFVFIKNKWAGIVITGTTGVLSLYGYFAISKHLTAAYFTPLFEKSIFTRFIYEGFYAGARYIFYECLRWAQSLGDYMIQSFTTGKFMGSNYCVLLFLCILLLVMFISYARKKKQLYAVIYGHYICTALISVTALLVIMHKMNEGSRHIISMIIIGCLLVSFMRKWRNIWRPLIPAVLILFLFYYYPDDGQDYQIPLRTQERYEEQQAWNEIVKDITLSGDAPSYENTVIWAFSDTIDGNNFYMPWQPMLAMPAGMGINCCQLEYTEPNWDNLQSRYIIIGADGHIAELCEQSNFIKIGEYDHIVMYQRY